MAAASAVLAAPEDALVSAEQAFAFLQRLPPPRAELRGEPPEAASVRLSPPLDFNGVTWPPELAAEDRAAIQIALNISGSYEGDDGWRNVTGNFDGQGFSLGLLNQCLGQGSLQPLLIQMRDRNPEKLKSLLASKRLDSLLGMLRKWESAPSAESFSKRLSMFDGFSEDTDLAISARNQESVRWAVANLYSGDSFDPAWKAELVALAASPEYVSLQIAAALGLHARALDDEARIGIRELRAYLMLFDVAVQNGGLYPDDLSDYAAYVRANPRATNTSKLKKLLELRLRHVRKKYVADVRSRKSAIIDGTGKVHGEKRNLPVEYSYKPAGPYR